MKYKRIKLLKIIQGLIILPAKMQYLYGKVDTKMNEVFETVAEVLEELRSEAGEREYSVCTKEAIFEELPIGCVYL